MDLIQNNHRRCRKCGAKLSSYNRDNLCYPCQESKEEQPSKLVDKSRFTGNFYTELDNIERMKLMLRTYDGQRD